MKKIKIVLILALLFSFSCASNNYWKLKIEIPGKTSFNLDQYNEVVITSFLIKEETKDFDLNQELIDYFSFEIGQNFNGKVSIKEITFEEEPFKNEAFWKNLLPAQKKAILFTGGAQYTEEIRKAILEKQKERFEDPFVSKKRGLAERRFYTLNLDLYIIDAKTGKALYMNNFKESKGYENPKQTAPFAFFDLIQRVKAKFFRNILAEPSIQERYLIYD
jgi:UDP-N-acetylglucosamine:LPS N-acetylglucosamine transferase